MRSAGGYRPNGMPYEEIDGVPLWFEEHGDPAGPPVVALHGGILTFSGSFGAVLPWLAEGRRVIGVELQGHGHTPDTGRAMSIKLVLAAAHIRPDGYHPEITPGLRPPRPRRRDARALPQRATGVLPATRHTEVMQRTDLRALVEPFLSR